MSSDSSHSPLAPSDSLHPNANSIPPGHPLDHLQTRNDPVLAHLPPHSARAHPPPHTNHDNNGWHQLANHRAELSSLNLPRRPSSLDASEPPETSDTRPRRKRLLDAPSPADTGNSSGSSRKRFRIHRRSRHTLDPFNFPFNPVVDAALPSSPLFFSNSPQPRPQLPPRFSSSEAAARMMSKAQGEETPIKTVALARGTLATGSPPARPLLKTRASTDRLLGGGARTESPELVESLDMLRMLGQIGITELLEQDERPTFIVDLGDAANFKSAALRVVFANSALRSFPGLLEFVTGTTNSPSTPNTFSAFKAWLLSAVVDGESLDVCLPSFVQDSFSWSCSTLRKRVRIIAGTLLGGPASNSSLRPPVMSDPPSLSMTGQLSSRRNPLGAVADDAGPAETQDEPQDYFGDAVSPRNAQTAVQQPVLPTVELDNVNHLDSKNTESSDPSINHNIDSSEASQGTSNSLSPNSGVQPSMSVGSLGRLARRVSEKEVGFFDWTRLPDSAVLPSHIRFARSVDWAGTALGPMDTWSADLRQMCNLIMASPHPAAMYWGDDMVAIYNEAYVLLAGQKHPKLMGQSYREAWSEIWDEVKDVFANARMTGEATMKDDDCLFIKRNDFLEETYFSWSIIPMVGEDGSVMGLYNPAFEKTRRKIAERRMLTLREVGERTAAARDVKGFWDEVLAALECNDLDTPFVLLYSIADETESETSSVHSSSFVASKQCYLEGALGVPEGHVAAPDVVDLNSSMEGFVPMFREVMRTNKPRLLDVDLGEIPATLVEDLEWRGFGDPAKAVVICPIHPTTGDSILGFLVLGVNPRRPYDDDYALFVQLLSRQLATSLASVVLFEEEIRRGQRAAKLAALDRYELSEQLAARTQEARDSETKFTRMAELAPVGMFIANSHGRITYCNDSWYEISRVPKESHSTDQWIEFVLDEDKELVKQVWHDLVFKTKLANAEFRFKAPWLDRNGVLGETWVLLSAYPEKNDQGALKSIFGSITNISQQKWVEGLQKRKMEEAVELKRQQENFIDITSHEMRNPLSAILQCSDEIISSLSEARSRQPSGLSTAVFDDNIDAAQTIALCAQHQKRIVDDVLTLSKLDSALLMVTPVDVQPMTVVQRALKMFEGELQTADILMKFVVDRSFKDLNVDWVRFDPSRVLQVLINLTTNAIKFTTTESKRTITVTIAASLQKPSSDANTVVSYFPSRAKRIDIFKSPDWGDGEDIYIHFAVEDTGRGLSDEEKKLLFQRFSQASPRTHVQYGGSGLGLFISRELTELQGGEIGVASEAGRGSTFAFYIKAKRTNPPAEAVDQGPAGMTHRSAEIAPVMTSAAVTMTATAAVKSASPKTRDFAGESRGASKSEANPSPLRVLIVEDNLVNQRVLQKQLKNIGCVVTVANHGAEALERLRESTFWTDHDDKAYDLSVVLMDQEMPVMDGLTCTKEIRRLEKEGRFSRHIPIIAVTANARSEQIKTAMEAGMDDVVSKPFRVQELIPKVEELLKKFQTKPS